MHVIRLRNPWTVSYDNGSGTVIFARKFHRPTGTENLNIQLWISLLQPCQLVVRVNGQALYPLLQNEEQANYDLRDLSEFNLLELVVDVAQDQPEVAPVFGEAYIKSVEIRIE